MDIQIKQNVIRSSDGRIKYKRFSPNGRDHYHLGVWIDGEERDLDQISFVEYRLHSTFTNPLRRSASRRNNFSITFWTWGMFQIEVTLHLHNGQTQRLSHNLAYQLPADEGNNYVDVSQKEEC